MDWSDGKGTNVNLLMIACLNAADLEAMDAIYTLIDNCPDLINARDSKGYTAIYYSLMNSYTLPFEVLLRDYRTKINVASNTGFTPLQALVSIYGAHQYPNQEQAIWIMLKRGASLISGGAGLPSPINMMIERNDPLVRVFRPVAEQQYQEYMSRQR
ncbi:MAG: hypothetical protein IJ587_04185 [Synergistaceae bacterium]|nr:hypothetical protein [Synergistaceae bacterium]